jgi:hypothetical protein
MTDTWGQAVQLMGQLTVEGRAGQDPGHPTQKWEGRGQKAGAPLTNPLEKEVIHIRGLRVCRRRGGSDGTVSSKKRLVDKQGGDLAILLPDFGHRS